MADPPSPATKRIKRSETGVQPSPAPALPCGSFESETTNHHGLIIEHGCTGCTGSTGRELPAREANSGDDPVRMCRATGRRACEIKSCASCASMSTSPVNHDAAGSAPHWLRRGPSCPFADQSFLSLVSFVDPLADPWRVPLDPSPTPWWPFVVLRVPSWITLFSCFSAVSSSGAYRFSKPSADHSSLSTWPRRRQAQ